MAYNKEKQALYRILNRVRINQRARAKYAADPASEIERHRRWVDQNKDHLRDYDRSRYQLDPEPKKEQSKSFRDRNPGRNAEACRNYQQRRRQCDQS